MLSCDLPSLTFLPWVTFSPLKSHYTSQYLTALPSQEEEEMREREEGVNDLQTAWDFSYSIVSTSHRSCGCHVCQIVSKYSLFLIAANSSSPPPPTDTALRMTQEVGSNHSTSPPGASPVWMTIFSSFHLFIIFSNFFRRILFYQIDSFVELGWMNGEVGT